MSFVETIFKNLRSRGPRPAVIDIVADTGQVPVSAEVLYDLTQRARTWLHEAGVKAGDRVGLLSPNCAKWAAADLAILGQGAICVPLYARQDPDELAYMMRDCQPSALICQTEELAEKMRQSWPEHCPIVVFDALFLATPSPEAPHAFAENETVTIIYTSGTSGHPKGVMLSRANVDFMLPTTASALADIRGPSAAGEDKVFHFLPFCFAGSRMMLWTQLYRGNPIMASTDLTRLADEMKIADPNYYLNVPAVLERIRAGVTAQICDKGGVVKTLYERGLAGAKAEKAGTATLKDRLFAGAARRIVFPKIKAKVGPSLDFLICGSAPLSADTQWWFETLGINVYQVYGLTETTAIVTMDKLGMASPGKVGSAVAGVEVKLGDGDELMTRGPHIFQGYWNLAEQTTEALDKDGWFRSGDQAEVDSHGRWRIVGRVKNLLVPESGHNIAPEPIEEKLRTYCPGIEHAVLIGHAKPFLTAIVTGEVTREAVQAAVDQVNGEVPHYRKIRGFHLSEEPLTPENGLLTANQKLKRKVIETHFATAIEALYAR